MQSSYTTPSGGFESPPSHQMCDTHAEPKVLWGKNWKCKSCNREYQREWLKNNREIQLKRIKDNTKKVLAEIHNWILEYLKTHPCVDCGEDDPIVLEFDHINPENKKTTVSSLRTISLKSVKIEVEKCEVRCANCHRRKTAIQLGWYNYGEVA